MSFVISCELCFSAVGVIISAISCMSRSVANETMLLGLDDSGPFDDDGRDVGVITSSGDCDGAADEPWASEETPYVAVSRSCALDVKSHTRLTVALGAQRRTLERSRQHDF